MMTLRYWGESLSNSGVLWRCELHQRGDHVPTELDGFPGEPLTIEWNADGGKMATLHTSAATLNVISKTDRQFLDLYQVEVGVVMLKVYRNGLLYWSGSLDPELYEEPYAYLDGYDVTLTFSDLASLDRVKWSRTGHMTFEQIIIESLNAAGIEHNEIVKHISTSVNDYSQPLTLSEYTLMCANFYDEDGEPMTVREVLEETLKPLALHLIQKNGRVLIFDTNALHALPSTPVVWASTDSNLSTDETYNNVTVNFSPYGDSEILKIEMDEKTTAADDTVPFTVHVDYATEGNVFTSPEGFLLYVGDKAKDNKLTLSGGARFFRIEPEYSNGDAAGVVMTARSRISPSDNYRLLKNTVASSGVYRNGVVISRPIIRTHPAHIALPTYQNKLDYKLKVSVELLFDVRYNPFEQSAEDNERGDWNSMKNWCNFGYIPLRLVLQDEAGRVLYHYRNKESMLQDTYVNRGEWVEGDCAMGECFLAYYDSNDRRSSTGFGAWAKNKPCIGYYQGELPSNMTVVGEGEFVKYPPSSGYLVMEIGSGVHQFDWNRQEKDIHPYVRWVMYRNMKIEVVKRNGRPYEVEDLEYKAWINRQAHEDLTIDTVIGTLPTASPTARGQILHSNDVVKTIHRAGITDSVEKLLIGTAYSAYANRSNILSGTVNIISDYTPMSDANVDGKYMVLSEHQKTWEDESEITMVEFTADNYEGIDYDE